MASAVPAAGAKPAATRDPRVAAGVGVRARAPVHPNSASSEAPARNPTRAPYFEIDAPPARAISLALHGTDPLAPRALGLWRLHGARTPELVAVTASDRSGSFDFGQVLIPARGAEWAVAPIERADAANAPARSRLAIAGVAPAPPRAE